MAGNYRTFLKILEKWPVDPSRKGRDLGEYIRQQVKIAFSAGEAFQGDEEKCRLAAESLNRLSENHYGKLYKRVSKSSSTGLSAEQCNGILSSEFIEFMEEDQRGLISQLFRRK